MEPIDKVTSIITPLDRVNVDTDQIISKEFLKRIERTGFGQYLFYHWRYDNNGKPIDDFVLNDERYKGSNILVANENFGCGSSREHAPWAIVDYGFRVIIAPSFADIFFNNCTKNGILPVVLELSEVQELLAKGKDNQFSIDVDLQNQTVTTEEGKAYAFEIDPYFKEMLINGWDEIAITLNHEDEIKAYEEKVNN